VRKIEAFNVSKVETCRIPTFPFPKMSYDSVESERAAVVAYAAANPFPPYSLVHRRIMALRNDSVGDWMTLYRRDCHDALAAAYAAGMSREAVRAAGQKIHDVTVRNHGEEFGTYGMQCCYRVFEYFSPFANASSVVRSVGVRSLEWAWDGIGTWQS